VRKPAICILVLLLFGASPAAERKQIAVIFDDLPASREVMFKDQLRMNQQILEVLDNYHAKATGFVIVDRLNGRPDIVDLWLNQGHELGNHTCYHTDFDDVRPGTFRTDISKGASALREILEKYKATLTYFRFPYFHEGKTPEKKAAIRRFLSENGWVVAPVTINLKDPDYNELFLKAWGSNDGKQQDSIRMAYLEQVKRKTEEAEDLARELVGRDVRHILLLHLNRINAETMDQILAFYSNSGYSFISLSEALQDSVYSLEENYVGSEELTWLERLRSSRQYR
jgi:peptidoglycan/xylan/chitin deacetylase (PgdA/CDA1 family)